MKSIKYNGKSLISIIVFFILIGNCQARDVITLQTGWKFKKGSFELASQPGFNDSKWQNVSIPHDWAIEGPVIATGEGGTGKLPWKDEAWYRKKLDIPAGYSGKQIYLVFDGIMACPEIYINGKLAGKWDYGYTSFYLDVTRFLQLGKENILAVHVDNRNHESRWYPGAGIYRKVQMIVENPIHVGIWGTFVTTPEVKSNYAKVRIMTTVFNYSATNEDSIKIDNIIINPQGAEVAKKIVNAKIASGKSSDVEVTISVTNAQLWNIESPALYQIKTVIRKGDVITDTYFTTFGIRKIRFTPNNGLYVNDKRVQIKGVNLHHDQGPLGSAFYPRAIERQIEIMKSMGSNAIRTSHNVPAPELLDLCDKMGMLVFNEAFDKYDKKVDIYEGTDFEDYASRNIKNFVIRDRNHPSVFIWSVGNEMHDVQDNINNGFFRLNTMVTYVRKYDPSRPVTMASDNDASSASRHFDYYDVLSYNYTRRWSLARQLEPTKSILISESASTYSTRGYYDPILPKTKTEVNKTPPLQVSSYDLNAPGYAELPDDDFMWQENEEYIAGEFVWTGFDYLGEPSPYSNGSVRRFGLSDSAASRSSYYGIVDLGGIPKDRYYLYKSNWAPEVNTVHMLPHWNWEGKVGEKVPVFIYTNGDCAELFVNGKSMGIKRKNPVSPVSIERFRLMWNDIIYHPGEIKAVAYKDGVVIGETIIKTAGQPYEIRLTPDRSSISVGGMDLSYVLVEVFDKNGNACPLAINQIEFTLSGPGKIAGVTSGNPQSLEEFQANKVNLFYGKAMLVLKSDIKKGDLKVTASSDGLVESSKIIKIE